jgi:hypothetical protein
MTLQENQATSAVVHVRSSPGDGRISSYFKPPPSTEDRFIFPAELFSHLPSFKMFPEYITASLPDELSGKIKESEWSTWMQILIEDRKNHQCGDSLTCCAISCLSVVCCLYPCARSATRDMSMEKFLGKMNAELFVPKGMFIKQQDGYVMGTPSLQGSPQCYWFVISLNQKESEKLKKEPKRVSLKL